MTQPETESPENDIRSRVPEPALIRGLVTSAVALVAVVTGVVVPTDWLEPALAAYAVIVPLALSLWIRAKVSPVPKGRHAK